jgi:phage recombination protein Bet
VTTEQLDLIRRTVANGATADELKLYLFDCARQGVHPLDRLIHFTVRKDRDGGRKYTPVTSIDFMRIRAAESGEYAGSDDAVFEETINGVINHARVTVWRLVQGQKCSFTATARWAEYKPEFNDFMWKRMPHTMLAKCAEALALRKGFPRQLAGLYAREEMEQAAPDSGEAGDTILLSSRPRPPAITPTASTLGQPSDNGPDLGVDIPHGFRLIDDYKLDGDWHRFTWGRDAQGGWQEYKTKLAHIAAPAVSAFATRVPVKLLSKKLPYLDKVEVLGDA